MSPPEFAGKQLSAHKAPVWKKSPRTFQEVRTGAPLPHYCCSVGNKLTIGKKRVAELHDKPAVFLCHSHGTTQVCEHLFISDIVKEVKNHRRCTLYGEVSFAI